MDEALREVLVFIENHGLALFLVALFVVFLIQLWKILKPLLEKLLHGLISYEQDPHEEYKKNYLSVMRYNQEITAQITMLIKSLDCDRVAVFQFHNGGQGLNGLPFIKVSRTHEVVSYGVTSIMARFQAVPIAMFAWATKAILENQTVFYRDVGVLVNDDDTALAILNTMEVKAIYVKPIKDFFSVPIGFLTIEYRETQNVDELTPIQINMIIETAARIGVLLTDAQVYNCKE